MSVPTGGAVEAQAQSSGTGGSTAAPSSVPPPCPSGDVPKEGSRDIQQKGKIISVPHDWCKSTDSPVPYKIWAWQSSASNLANTVRQTDCRSHVLGSIVNQCYGDEPGTGGGVRSGTNLAECTPLSASPTVRAENKPMVRYLDKWWMNHKNTWGCLNNSEDMGKYAAPKIQTIDRKMVAQAVIPGGVDGVPLPPVVGNMTVDSAKSAGQGLSQAAPDKDDTVSDYLSRPYVNLSKKLEELAGYTKIDIGGKVQWVRVSKPDPQCGWCKTTSGRFVEAGTWGYSPLDIVPQGQEQHGVEGNHYNLWLANQIPHPDCRCQWARQPFAAAEDLLPIGAVPWEPFINTP